MRLLSPVAQGAGPTCWFSGWQRSRSRIARYQVPALRSLGLALGSIAVCLDAGVDPTRLVRDHLAGVEASITALGVLRERLVRLDEELSADRAPTATALVDALRAVAAIGPEGEHTLGRHLYADQIQVLHTRAAALGPVMHYVLEVDWPELYRRAERLRAAGTRANVFGAAGALGALVAVLALREQAVPPTINLDSPDPRIDLDIVTGRPPRGPVTAALANSFGFGGHNVWRFTGGGCPTSPAWRARGSRSAGLCRTAWDAAAGAVGTHRSAPYGTSHPRSGERPEPVAGAAVRPPRGGYPRTPPRGPWCRRRPARQRGRRESRRYGCCFRRRATGSA